MPSWDNLLLQFDRLQTDQEKTLWLRDNFNESLAELSRLCSERNIIIYGSAFLQKPTPPRFSHHKVHEGSHKVHQKDIR